MSKILKCSDDCKLKERNRKLAEALSIDPLKLKKDLYSPKLMRMVKHDLLFTKNMEAQLDKLSQSETKIVHRFPKFSRHSTELIRMLVNEVYHNIEHTTDDFGTNSSITILITPAKLN